MPAGVLLRLARAVPAVASLCVAHTGWDESARAEAPALSSAAFAAAPTLAAAPPLVVALPCAAAAPRYVLRSRPDPFDGVSVGSEAVSSASEFFEHALDHSIDEWISSGRRGVWLTIPIEHSALIPVAVQRGFAFHCAERSHVVMNRWLPADEPSPLPANASHQCGVGSLVVDSRGRVLLVQEAVGPLRNKDVWKIPTGLLEAREDVGAGAVRETFEETGIACTFERVVAVRHSHHALHGKSDLFFVCVLRPLKDDLPFTLQRAEIARAKWADFREFVDQAPYPRDMPQWSRLYELCQGVDGALGTDGLRAETFAADGPGRLPSTLYYA